ncbi:MAG: hypothetical protein JSU77_12375 [Fidelibacterota bacterium]|nr:MAG: hypothetical protein JSU77_12375 [Candidatus Neomarinimicrobiota bacterium]
MTTDSRRIKKNRGVSMDRRKFLSGCAACVGYAATCGMITPGLLAAKRQGNGKPKIRLVFCEADNAIPIWPNIGYDFGARRKQMTELLTAGAPGLEFSSSRIVDNPEQLDKVLEQDTEVDGYVICVQGLGWENDIVQLSSTGKPTLLVDNLFGGSGKFLLEINRIMNSGQPVDWVSSSNDRDIIASARHFELLKEGQTPAEVAAMFREERGKRTPTEADWTCKSDPVAAVNFDTALKRLKETKILVVGNGWGGDDFRKAAQEVMGVQLVPVTFEEIASAYDQADKKAARASADTWIDQAEKIIDVDRGEIERSAAMYVGMKKLMDEHGARGISINCLDGFYNGHLKAYPCLGFCQLNNDGSVGGCESDQISALTMATMSALTGRPGYISDPVIDTSKNAIIYAHCVAMTKPFGPEGISNAYHILTHSEDRKGASMRSLLPVGYMTTTLEIDPVSRQVLMHQAKSIGNNPSDMACRTKLEAVVKGDLEKLTEGWSMGWHRVTFYGDLKEQMTELCDRLELELIEEA